MALRIGFDFRLAAAIGGAALALLMAIPSPAKADDVLVFAAASLKNAFDNINAAWREETGNQANISYAASSALARQIEEGAPADLFISADLAWMDYLAERDLIQPETRIELLGNRLVLIAAAETDAEIAIEPGFDLAGLLGDDRLAVGNVDAVPAGRYAKAALESLGIWEDIEGRLAQAENVRAAMALVSLGEAPFGIVYATDAAADPAVKVVGLFPEDTHEPIIYPVALTADSANPLAPELLAYLRSQKAHGLFEEQGFTVLLPALGN